MPGPKFQLPGKRYLIRELIPRAILLAVTFKLVMPALPFHLFQFEGSWALAAAFGVTFTAYFCLIGSYLMGSSAAQKFMADNKSAWWFIPANVLFVIGMPVFALAAASTLIASSVLIVHGVWGMLAGSVLLNVACALTHDYKS